jgi:hypothetical protein
MWKHLRGDYQTHRHKTDRLTQTLAQTQTPPDLTTDIFLLPESPPSELNFNLFRTARTAHSTSQAWRTLAVVLGYICTMNMTFNFALRDFQDITYFKIGSLSQNMSWLRRLRKTSDKSPTVIWTGYHPKTCFFFYYLIVCKRTSYSFFWMCFFSLSVGKAPPMTCGNKWVKQR